MDMRMKEERRGEERVQYKGIINGREEAMMV